MMKIDMKTVIDKDIEKVWELIGPCYADVGNWASAVYRSQALEGTNVVGGAPVTGRVCETSLGPFCETIVLYDGEKKLLAYHASGEKMPFFVKQLQGSWRLNTLSSLKTEVIMTLEADLMFPFSFLMGWVMRMQFSRVLNETLEELKYYLEAGHIHSRKSKIMNKIATA